MDPNPTQSTQFSIMFDAFVVAAMLVPPPGFIAPSII
jgi:hypothetical protein